MTAKAIVSGVQGPKQIMQVAYDFAKDGGVFGAGNEIKLFDLVTKTIIHDFWAEVETAPTSLGGATLEVGVTGGDTDSILTQAGIAAYPANFISGEKHKGVALSELITLGVGDTQYITQKYKVAAATTLSLLIGTASLTAGKIRFYCEYSMGF